MQPTIAPQPAPPVRWTIVDLALIVGLTIVLVTLFGALLSLATRFGFNDPRAFLRNRPVLAVVTSVAVVDLLAVLATALVIVARKRGSWREIGFRRPPLLPMLLTPIIFAGQMLLIMLINIGILLSTGSFENPQRNLFTDPGGFTWSNYVLAMVAGAIIAPIVEELIFRGLLYQWLRSRTNVAIAVLLSGAIFGAIHMIPIAFPALFVVGVVLALAFQWSKSLWVPITLHVFQNAFVISLIFWVQANPQLFPQTA